MLSNDLLIGLWEPDKALQEKSWKEYGGEKIPRETISYEVIIDV